MLNINIKILIIMFVIIIVLIIIIMLIIILLTTVIKINTSYSAMVSLSRSAVSNVTASDLLPSRTSHFGDSGTSGAKTDYHHNRITTASQLDIKLQMHSLTDLDHGHCSGECLHVLPSVIDILNEAIAHDRGQENTDREHHLLIRF